MSATSQLDILDGGLAAGRIRNDVVVFKKSLLVAAMTILGYEGALTAIALLHLSSDMCRDMP